MTERQRLRVLLLGCAIALVGAMEQPNLVHRIPARQVRQMLAATTTPTTGPAFLVPTTPALDPLQPPPKLAVRQIIVGISRPLVMQQMPPVPTADLILEPLTNGCFLVIVTNADPTYVWTVQRSTNLLAWADAQSLSNADNYSWVECFPTNVDNLFLRLLDP